MIELQDDIYVDTNRGIKAPRLSYILDMIFPKPPYANGAAERGAAIHEWLEKALRAGRGQRVAIEDSGPAAPYIENYQKFLAEYKLSTLRGRAAEVPFMGSLDGRPFGYDRDFYYGCRVDAIFPKRKLIVEIKTGSPGPRSSLEEMYRDEAQVLMQRNAIMQTLNSVGWLPTILYVSPKKYISKIVTLDFEIIKKTMLAALAGWYSKYGGKLK